MSAAAEEGGLDDAARSADDWTALDREAQDELLTQQIDGHDADAGDGESTGGGGEFEHAEMAHAEKMNTMAAIVQMVENETWTETVLGDIEIEFRCITNERADRYRELQERIGRAEAELTEAVEEADNVEEIDAEAMSELDDTDEIEADIIEFVAEVTAEDWLTREWLETEEYPERLVGQLMGRVRERNNNRGERIEKFQ